MGHAYRSPRWASGSWATVPTVVGGMMMESLPEETSTICTSIRTFGIGVLADGYSFAQPNNSRRRGSTKRPYSCLKGTRVPGSSTSKWDGRPTATAKSMSDPAFRCRFSDTGLHVADWRGDEVALMMPLAQCPSLRQGHCFLTVSRSNHPLRVLAG